MTSVLGDRGRVDALRGFTLTELLVVITIVGTLVGVSLSVYQNVARNHAVPAATLSVSSVVRAARNSAISSGLRTRILVDVDSRTVTGFEFDVANSFSFEDGLQALELDDDELDDPLIRRETAKLTEDFGFRGAFSERTRVVGDAYLERGQVAFGVAFDGNGGHLVTEHRPRQVSANGFAIEAWVKFEPPRLTSEEREDASDKKGAFIDPRRDLEFSLMSKPGAFEIGVYGDGAVFVTLGSDGEGGWGTNSGPSVIPEYRWCHVRAIYDSRTLIFEVDGADIGLLDTSSRVVDTPRRTEIPTAIPRSSAPFLISHPDRGFSGVIDEVVFRVASEPRQVTLPDGMEFLHEASFAVQFDSRGALDPLFHSAPVAIRIGDPTAGADSLASEDPEADALSETLAKIDGEDPDDAASDAAPDPQDAYGALSQILDDTEVLNRFLEGAERGEIDVDLDPSLLEREDRPDSEDGPHVRTIIIDMTGSIRMREPRDSSGP